MVLAHPTQPNPQPQDVTHVALLHSEKDQKKKTTEFVTKMQKKNVMRFDNNAATSIAPHKTQVKRSHRPLRSAKCDDESPVFTDSEA